MFRFGAVEMLLGLLALPVVAVFLYMARRQVGRAIAAFGDPSLVQRLSAGLNRRGRIVKGMVMIGVIGLLVVAMARPQFGTRVETVRRKGLDVMVAIDVSRSMLAEDIAPNRLDKAKFIVADLIRRLDGDRIGLVAFAGDAFVQSPLTLDYAAASLFLNAMEPDMVSVQGTNLGAALSTALDAFEAGTNQHRVLITITDGEDHEGAIDEAVARAEEDGVRIFAIGMGTPDGVPIPEYDASGGRTGFVRDEDGTVVTSRLDEATLERITDATGGAYYRATARGSELNELGRELTGEEGQELEAQQVTRFEEQFQMFLGLALILLVVEMLIPDRRSVRARWIGTAR